VIFLQVHPTNADFLSAKTFLKGRVVFFASFLVEKRVWFFVGRHFNRKKVSLQQAPKHPPGFPRYPPGFPRFFLYRFFLGRKKGILQEEKEGNSSTPPGPRRGLGEPKRSRYCSDTIRNMLVVSICNGT